MSACWCPHCALFLLFLAHFCWLRAVLLSAARQMLYTVGESLSFFFFLCMVLIIYYNLYLAGLHMDRSSALF